MRNAIIHSITRSGAVSDRQSLPLSYRISGITQTGIQTFVSTIEVEEYSDVCGKLTNLCSHLTFAGNDRQTNEFERLGENGDKGSDQTIYSLNSLFEIFFVSNSVLLFRKFSNTIRKGFE